MKSDLRSQEQQAERLVKEAQASKLTLVTAESCTAGALAHLLAGAPGAAEVLHGGFVVYTKEHKTIALDVPAALIAKHTAVSAEVAEAMAEGALRHSQADLAISITGVIGPEPDEDGNPVGLVHFGIAGRDGFYRRHTAHLGEQSKDEICAAVLDKALLLLQEAVALSAGGR
jgi:nicotinamide-nucleotide amidase